jgi:DHA1 family tetracycline resistance protein-like MFS transporter
MSFANFLYGFAVLPESLSPQHRNAFSWRRANPLGSIKLLRRHHELSGLSLVNLIGYIAHEALPQIFVLYTLYAYAWTMRTVGLSLAFVGITTILVSAFVIQRVVDRFGERRAVMFGLLFGGVGYLLYGGNAIMFWIAIPVMMLWMVASSASQAIMTRRVGKGEQGELQGAINMLRSIGMLVGPGIFTGAFAYSISSTHAWKAPNLPWILGAAMLFVSMILTWNVTSAQDEIHEIVEVTEAPCRPELAEGRRTSTCPSFRT